MTLALSDPTVHSAYKAGAWALLLAVAAIVGALGFQHIGGIQPCELCLEQRYAYYAGVPLLFIALVLLSSAAVLGRTLLRLSALNPGIDIHNLLAARVAFSPFRAGAPRRAHVRLPGKRPL